MSKTQKNKGKKEQQGMNRDDKLEEEIIEEISQQVLQKLSGGALSLDSTTLNLSEPRFQLINLNGLMDSAILQMEKLLVLNISNNKLRNIDIVSSFRSLQNVNASKNQIIGCELDLPRITELELSYNRLQTVPDLAKMPKIENIFLQYNQITSVDKEFLVAKATLSLISLSANKIQFTKGKNLQLFINNLKMMTVLTTINIDKNSFCDSYLRYKDYFIRYLTPQLEIMNNQVIEEKVAKAVRNEQNFPDLDEIVIQNTAKTEVKKGDENIITLQYAVKQLEECREKPQNSIDILQELNNDLIKIASNQNNYEKMFLAIDNKQQSIYDDMCEDFLQNIVILIENQTHIAKTLMQLLCVLSVIPVRDVGFRCICILKGLLMGGQEQKDTVFQMIKENLVPLISQIETQDIPRQVLKGLISLIDSTQDDKIYSLFNDNQINYMEHWCKQILAFMQLKERSEDEAVMKMYALQLVSVTSKLPKNANYMFNLNIAQYCQQIYKLIIFTSYNMGYIYSLEILKNIFENVKSAAQDVFTYKENMNGFYQELLRQFKEMNLRFKELGNDLRDVKAKDSDIFVKIKFKKFAQVIETFGSLYKYYTFTVGEFNTDEVIATVLSYSNLFRINSQLIITISLFIQNLLKNTAISLVELCIKNLIQKSQKFISLISFLNKKYNILCEVSEIYFTNTFFNGEPVNKEINNNPMVHSAFKEILDLFYFFISNSNSQNTETENEMSNNTQATPIQELCNEVVKSQQDKEQTLFNCLDFNNENVKMSAIKCLLAIHPNEWKADLLERLFSIAESYQNYGYGNTETILSCIFIIFIRVLRNTDSEVTQEFLSRSSGRINSACLEILMRTMARNLKGFSDQVQEQNKINLALSCVFFLKTVSEIPQARNFSANQCRQAIQSCLKNEEMFMNESFIQIDIERTILGKNLEYLIGFTGGDNAVNPYHIVSYRILSQIADMLEGQMDEQVNITSQKEKFDPQYMKQTVQKQLEGRIEKEFDIWDEQKDKNTAEYEHFKKNPIDYDTFINQHSLFSKQAGIEKLLFYLVGKTASQNAQLLQNQLNNEFNPKYENLQFKENLIITTNKYERDEKKRQIYMQNILDNGQINLLMKKPEKVKLEQEEAKDLIQTSFQQQSTFADLDPKILEKFILQAPAHLESNILQENNNKDNKENTNKKPARKKNSGNNNEKKGNSSKIMLGDLNYEEQYEEIIKKRCLIVCTMLRAMYNSIEYAPQAESKKSAIDQLKRRANIKMLTQLCGTTGWIMGNIGIKYLKIIYYGMQLSNRTSQEDKENTEIYEIVSYAMIEMIGIINIMVIQQDKTELKFEYKILLYYLAYCSNLIIQQVPSMIWSTVDTKCFTHTQKTLQLSPNDKAIGFLISKLFPRDDIKIFIEDLSYEMRKIKNISFKNFREDLALKDHLKFNGNTRQQLIRFFGNYLARSNDQCFEIMQFFVYGEVIEKKEIRQTFLQEVLNEMTRSLFKKQYQKLIYRKMLGHKPGQFERVIEMFDVLICDEGTSFYYQRHIIMTDRLMYIFVPAETKCTCCPAEFFCPDLPVLEFKFEYKSILFISVFEGGQRLAFRSNEMKKLNQKFTETIFAKNHSEIFKIIFFPKLDQINLFLDITRTYSEIYFQNDEIAQSGFNLKVKDCEYSAWVILNPNKRLISRIQKGERVLNYANQKSLLVIYDKTIIFYKDVVEKWFFFDNRQIKQVEELLEVKQEKVDTKTMDYQKEQERKNILIMELKNQINRMRAVQEKFFIINSSEYDFSQTKNFRFETSNAPIISISFGQLSNLEILFFCDTARQQFREVMNQYINYDDFKTDFYLKNKVTKKV